MAGGGGAPLVVVAAGGTGGHLFPAEALALALERRRALVDLATDERATRYGRAFPARMTHIIPSATVRGRDPLSLARTAITLMRGTAAAYRLLARLQPAVVVGFGGYPSIPPVLAATFRRIPTVIHEQNGVMGRANRFLSSRVDAIATGFPDLFAGAPQLAAKATCTGNPVRPAVTAAAGIPHAPPDRSGTFRLLVFGGSQGARIMADVVPAAVQRLAEGVRSRLAIVQQAREEDLGRVKEIYENSGVTAEVATFFADLPARMAQSHLVVARSGASTVAELAVIGRPAVLVPLPHALDQDQLANAAVLERAGGAIRIDQPQFTPERLASELTALMGNPGRLAAMAAAASSGGTADAADRLAELVLKTARRTGERTDTV